MDLACALRAAAKLKKKMDLADLLEEEEAKGKSKGKDEELAAEGKEEELPEELEAALEGEEEAEEETAEASEGEDEDDEIMAILKPKKAPRRRDGIVTAMAPSKGKGGKVDVKSKVDATSSTPRKMKRYTGSRA